ncbi:ObirObp59a [Ooceraea biroi]|uniref:ObirObp59a n=1 Tax=Ooceraea biroi TaxID=2015173 RepID=A0A026WHY9_OOCBI|nr:hypothetical protein X777_04999 [Ooceraea biroi]RLU20266.1 ObirObp59a [Ooceraea biroi]
MTRVILVALCSVCLLLVEPVTSLKCRTGVQQADEQFRKIVQMCKKRYTNDDVYSDDSSSNDEESDDSLGVDVFDTKFFLSGDSRSSNAQSWKDQNNNWNHGNNQRNGNNQHHSFNYTNGNWRDGQYPNRGSNNRDFVSTDGNFRPNYGQVYNNNPESYNKEQEQACIIQCFFNELNVVDHRGFPEQNSIIQLMTQNTHNPELQDFVEEAIIECYHYLSSDMKQEKCRFSQNLLTCLADKGKERCEDWDD